MNKSLVEAFMCGILSKLKGYLKEIRIDVSYHGIPIARLTNSANEPAKVASLEIKADSRKKRVVRQRSYYPSQKGAWDAA